MNIDDCFQLGYVIKPHGLKGELDVYLDTDIPENYHKLESVFVEINQKLVPFFISNIQIRHNKAILKLEEVDTIERALELKACSLYLPLDLLPPLEGNAFYFHEVVGFIVVDKTKGILGPITRFYNYPSQDLFAVNFDGSEVLIPVKDQIILNVDREEKQIEVDLPEGLIDIYTSK